MQLNFMQYIIMMCLPISILSSRHGYTEGSLQGQRSPDWDRCDVSVYPHQRALQSAWGQRDRPNEKYTWGHEHMMSEGSEDTCR